MIKCSIRQSRQPLHTLKKKRHKDLVVEKADFADRGFEYIEVTGKVKEGESKQYVVNVSYNDNYRVTSIVDMN
ncbi:hypothetical protein F3K44_18030 [Bacillus megaterium]|nr:hypothetical protein [Priestia megaterium]